MSGNRTERRPYPTEVLGYQRLRDMIDAGVNAAVARALDLHLGGRGGVLSAVAVTPTSPASLSVEVAALEGYDRLGRHLRTALATTVDVSVDYNGVSTIPTSGSRWISIFATFSWAETDAVSVTGYDDPFYKSRTESVSFQVRIGTASQHPANPGGGAIRVCSILITEAAPAITAGMIHTSNSDPIFPWTFQDSIGIAVFRNGDQLTGILKGRNGWQTPEVNYGFFGWTTPRQAVPVSPEDGYRWFPRHFEGYWMSNFLVTHGIASPYVKFTFRPSTADPVKTFRPLYTDIMTYMEAAVTGSSIQVMQAIQVHDGGATPVYTGQALCQIIGNEAFVDRMINRGYLWEAIYTGP